MADKLSYLGLLNAIAVGEGRGYRILQAWSAATTDAELRATLERVAIRERSHAATFEKRVSELGYGLRQSPSKAFEAHLALVGKSHLDDRTKFEQVLGYGQQKVDPLAGLFDDATIDPRTGALLGRFIADERDSGRQLRGQYDRIRREQQDPLEAISARLEQLTRTLEELKALTSQP